MDRREMSNEPVQKVAGEARRAVDEAVEADSFMVAVWKVQGGRIELTKLVTYKWPTGDFLPAVGHLALQCHEERMKSDGPPPLSQPLPRMPLGRLGLFRKSDGNDLVDQPVTEKQEEQQQPEQQGGE